MKVSSKTENALFGGSVGATGGSDGFGREMILKCWPDVVGGTPAMPELQLVQAKARQESNYGKASFRGPEGSAVLNNWGSVQCSHGPPCGDDCFLVTDSHTDGSKFDFCYKRYPDSESGCRDFLFNLLVNPHFHRSQVLAAAQSGSITDFAQAIFDTHYSELRVDKQIESYTNNVNAICNNLGEEPAVHVESGGGASDSSDDTFPLLLTLATAVGITYLLVRRA